MSATAIPVNDRPPLWVKICGLTTEEGVAAACAAGADAIGFVFAPSKRRITPQRAAELASQAPAHIERVAVMLHPTQAELDAVCDGFSPQVLQTDAEDLQHLVVPQALQIIPVIRDSFSAMEPLPARLLFEGRVSGVGATADWHQAMTLAGRSQLILAGGLNAANVGAAVAQVRPYGVDVSSGVERGPGIKDAEKIHEFVRAARSWGER